MKLVMLSGGSGKRLWPLSNNARSKQFLKVLSDSQGNRLSMVQRVWSQLNKTNLANNSIIATSISQLDIIRNQLGTQMPIVTEPERRDTFPAVALAAVYLYSVQNTDLDEVIGMLPVDSFVEDIFFEKVSELEKIINISGADLALIGVKPTFPSEKYGYIVPEKSNSKDFLKVSYFKEKPKKSVAEKLINEEAKWNCGVFAFKLKYIINLLKEKGLPVNYEDLLENYSRIPKNSFDYEVVEKAQHIVALPYEGYWKDLGTWNTLTDEMSLNITGNGIKGEKATNSYIINELDIPIILLGIENSVVAASPDGILITDKKSSPKVKEYVGALNSDPMYEELRWGWYHVLERTKNSENKEIITKKINITAQKSFSYQLKEGNSRICTITSGSGELILDNEYKSLKVGEVIKIPSKSTYTIRAHEEIELIEVQYKDKEIKNN